MKIFTVIAVLLVFSIIGFGLVLLLLPTEQIEVQEKVTYRTFTVQQPVDDFPHPYLNPDLEKPRDIQRKFSSRFS